jgi:PHD-finger
MLIISCEQVWDPKKAQSKGIFVDDRNDFIAEFPSNIKEAAIIELARQNYDLKKLHNIVTHLIPRDGSSWSNEVKINFHKKILKYRKDLTKVSKSLQLPFSVCMAYYLGTYKKSRDYRLLKTVYVEERLQKAALSDFKADNCAVCGYGGNLLICDECEGEYHLACVNPPLASVPEGRWECTNCADKKLVSSRGALIQNSNLFNKYTPQKRTFDGDNSNKLQPLKFNYRSKTSVLKNRA